MGRLPQLSPPGDEGGGPGGPGGLAESVDPPGQVVKVLAVPLPLEVVVERLVGSPLRQLLPDAQPAPGRVCFPFPLAETADPADAPIIRPMSAEHVMDLVHQPERQLEVAPLPRDARQTQ